MTSINDLPPELLYRIIYLASNNRKTLKNAARVARSWSFPAQELLLSIFDLSHRDPVKTRVYPAMRKKFRLRSVRRLRMKFLTKEDFDLATDGIEQLNRLILEREYVTFDVDCLSAMLLSVTNSVEIAGQISGVFPPPPPTLLLPLRHLFLTDDHFYEESTLTSLLAWAPNVASLELYYGKAARDRSEIQQRSPLAVLGPQLRHLGLWHPPVTAFDRALRTELATSFAAALPTCVNLVSLEVRPVTQSQITDLLPLVSSRLKVLETRWRGDLEWDTLELLELPALVELERWRIHFCESKVQVTEDLRAACADRGVEVRDYERFFTDHCYE